MSGATIKVLYFARVAELVGKRTEDWPLAETVTSAHRGDAFRGCEYIIDALKTRAPFWKRETLAAGDSFWVEQRQSDADRTQSWDDPDTPTKEHP